MNLIKSRRRHDCPTLFDALTKKGIIKHSGVI
jgi:hypothetical protein